MLSSTFSRSSESAKRLTLSLASTEEMLSWSFGLVSNPNTVTGKLNAPIEGGLLCPRIFGAGLNERCLCSEYNRTDKNFCSTCNVNFVSNYAARTRFGHIKLNVPVVHTWFYKVTQSLLTILTNLTSADVESLIKYERHLVKVSFRNFLRGQLISNATLSNLSREIERDHIVSGPLALQEAIRFTDLMKVKFDLSNQLTDPTNVKDIPKLTESLLMLESIIADRSKLDKLLLWVLPVLPAALRPALTSINGLRIDSALTNLYSRIISINNEIADLIKSASTSKRSNRALMFRRFAALQCAVDSLIGPTFSDGKSFEEANASLTDLLKGKKGHFRHALLGRRVDYSGRSVIVPGPELKLDECAIPFSLASKLFKPMVLAELKRTKDLVDVRSANQTSVVPPNIFNETLRKLITNYPIILNRAPTLHKLSMLAFKLSLTDIKAIKLHPLVCAGYNADFDGDQMAVHVPIGAQARREAEGLLMASRNIFHPAHGGVAIAPTKDMVLGLYYLSLVSKVSFNRLSFDSEAEVLSAFSSEKVKLHTEIQYYSSLRCKSVRSTPGRIMIAQAFPKKCAFVYSSDMLDMNKDYMNELIEYVSTVCKPSQTVKLCEALMALGFKFVSLSGLSFGSSFLARLHRETRSLYKQARIASYLASSDLRDKRSALTKVHSIWSVCLKLALKRAEVAFRGSKWTDVPEQILLASKASGSIEQMNQIFISKVDATSFSGRPCKMPIVASYHEGLSPMQMFYSTFSSRRGLIDTALKTAASGYFARKLVEALRECLVTEVDCGTTDGITYNTRDDVCTFQSSFVGRFLVRPISLRSGLKLTTTEMITSSSFKALTSENDTITIRSPITCLTSHGNVCSKCYGINFGTRLIAKIGDSVGIIAAQAISEPGTQLTLRTFHGSAVKSNESDDELVGKQILYSPCSGIVSFPNSPSMRFDYGCAIVSSEICMLNISQNSNVIWNHRLKAGDQLFVQNNFSVREGQALAVTRISKAQASSPVSSQTQFISSGEFTDELEVNSLSVAATSTSFNVKGNSPPSVKFSLGGENKSSHVLKPSSDSSSVNDSLTSSVTNLDGEFNSSSYLPEGFDKLSKLFNGSPSEIISCLISFAKQDSKLTSISEVDFVSPTFHTVGLFHPSDELIFQLPSNTTSASLVDDIFGLDAFVSLFINQVMVIYSSYGVNVHPKHLEIILKRMLGWVTVEHDPSGGLLRWTEVEWNVLRNLNKDLITAGSEPIVGVRRLINLTGMCNRNSSMFSDISVEGSVKNLAFAAFTSKLISLDGIKNSLIVGKMPKIGDEFKT
ncbi:MAG: hypothetical protein ACTS43_02275 [Candidatus Hodgkinia cicadicola]